MNERDYIKGQQAAWQQMLDECLRHLPQSTRKAHGWRSERAAAVIALRELCELHGDNDWPDDLHLADVIEKHATRYLNRWKGEK